MAEEPTLSRRSAVSRLHPLVYKTIAALAFLFAAAAWGFAGSRYTGYLLAVVSGFFLLAVALPWVLWRIWSGRSQGNDGENAQSCLRFWSNSDFETWTGKMRGRAALVEALLPIAAVALGMIAFAVALHIAV
jgi:hypothetical protein